MRSRWLRRVILAEMMLVSLASAQGVTSLSPADRAKEKGPKGAISGTVYCADTNLPARLAEVYVNASTDEGSGRELTQDKTATTDLDGHFLFPHLAEGTYFISVEYSGYLDLHARLLESRMLKKSAEARKEIESRLTVVKVVANQTTEIGLRVERGPEVNGTVLYDDGSPAIGLQVDLLPGYEAGRSETESLALIGFSRDAASTTDDHGRFRILGVPQGDYRVAVKVPASSPSQADDPISTLMSDTIAALIVFYGDTLRGSKAKVLHIGPAEHVMGADITIPLNSLHTVRGEVIVKSTGQAPPTAGVALLYADTRELLRASLARNGEFEFRYVPEGSFLLTAAGSSIPIPSFGDSDEAGGMGFMVSAPADLSAGEKDKNTAELPLQIKSDLDGITIAVPDPPKVPAAPQTPPANNSPSDSSTPPQ